MKTRKSVYTLRSIFPLCDEDSIGISYIKDDKNNFKCFIDDVGVFSSVKSAEKAMKLLIKLKDRENKHWNGFSKYVGFILEEHYLDDCLDKYGSICYFESARSYLSDGTLNCVSECDDRCEKKFTGTRYPNRHVKKGDIALVVRGSTLIPVLVERTSMTKDEWKKRFKKGVSGDYTDDSGLVFTAYDGHEHPFAPYLFPLSCLPNAKVEKGVIMKMKALRKGYFKGTAL